MSRTAKWFALMAVGICLLGTIVAAAGVDFLGTWENVNPKTRGLTKLVISQSGKDFYVEGFGSCTPTDCVWGKVDLHMMGYSVSDTDYEWGFAVWDPGFKMTYLSIHLEGDVLVAVLYDIFAPGDGRENYRSIALLRRP